MVVVRGVFASRAIVATRCAILCPSSTRRIDLSLGDKSSESRIMNFDIEDCYLFVHWQAAAVYHLRHFTKMTTIVVISEK